MLSKDGKLETFAFAGVGIFVLGYYLYSGCFAMRSPINLICEEPSALISVLITEIVCLLVVGSYLYGKKKRAQETENGKDKSKMD